MTHLDQASLQLQEAMEAENDALRDLHASRVNTVRALAVLAVTNIDHGKLEEARRNLAEAEGILESVPGTGRTSTK